MPFEGREEKRRTKLGFLLVDIFGRGVLRGVLFFQGMVHHRTGDTTGSRARD